MDLGPWIYKHLHSEIFICHFER